MPNLAEILTVGALSGGGGAALGVAALKVVEALLNRRRTPEQKLGEAASAASDLIKLALDASGSSVQQLLEQIDGLSARLEELEASHTACERRCEGLTGELRQANQKIDSLMRKLRDPSATSPGGVLSGALIELADGGVVIHPAGRGED